MKFCEATKGYRKFRGLSSGILLSQEISERRTEHLSELKEVPRYVGEKSEVVVYRKLKEESKKRDYQQCHIQLMCHER